MAVGLEVVVDGGLDCVFGEIDSTMELFSSTGVSYLFDVATVYVVRDLYGLFLVIVRCR